MDKQYNPQSIEQQWYPVWEKAGYFAPQGDQSPYCIMLPPPNVTGSLHMGHGFQHTLMDALIRYHRMCGHKTLWQAGVDHAGIATQMVVERQLIAEGQSRHDLGREAFVKRVWEWKHSAGQTISQQLRRMGSSIDWTRECFTLDTELSYAVSDVFVKLYEEGLIYRGKRLVNWDPKFHTAISDLEVVSEEEDGQLWYIRYPIANKKDHLIIATTRPETLLGDVAIAVHPSDTRYRHLIGEQVELPLTNRTIPIIADDYVDPKFGSGCVKITPAHDFNDYEVGKRHHLPQINIFTPDAKLNDNAPEAYRGMDRFDARKKIVADLEHASLIDKIEKHRLTIPRGDRSGEIIEPLLTDQWFVKTAELAGPAIEAVKNGEVSFVPNSWEKTYFQWLEHIEDWCISRQLWWGHRIPAWYDSEKKIYVGHNEDEVRKKHQLDKNVILHQDEDVLDTWFSAALWPFSTLGWPEQTQELLTFYPTSVLVTGFDIIFFWVARMMMMGLKFTGNVPFKEVYITGLIRDAEGHKMSKTKGNVIDPIDIIDGITLEKLLQKRTYGLMQPAMAKRIEKATIQQFPNGIAAYGTDALRFTFCALATTGRDIRFDLARVEGYRNFCNKLWNAARYVLMTADQHTDLAGQVNTANTQNIHLRLPDQWIVSRLHTTINEVTQHFTHYRFDLLAQAIYEFTWNDYCDWYLELSKLLLSDPKASLAEKRGTYQTLITVFEILLRLTHPIMPFITEEIWQRVAPLAGISAPSIMIQPYPLVEPSKINEDAALEMDWLKAIVTNIRNIRGEMNISPGKALPVFYKKACPRDTQRLSNHHYLITRLAKLTSLSELDANSPPPPYATSLVGDLELYVPLSDLIDKDAEQARLNKEIEKLKKEIERIEIKLSNANYREKAPADIVAKEQQRLIEFNSAKDKLQLQLSKLT